MKRILFPTDFSDVANNAFVHALGLAKLVHGELILLHTYELPIVDNQFAPQNYQLLFDSLELSNFEKFKDEVPKLRAIAEENHFEDIKMSHMIMDGDLMYNIKEIIKKDKIDYVVMGTSGATGWKEAFLGTNTGEAIVNLSVPVLSIPKDCKYTKIETIGFTTRYREKDKEALKFDKDAIITEFKSEREYLRTQIDELRKQATGMQEQFNSIQLAYAKEVEQLVLVQP
jgi:nucleotide-binding universal stress UspA family protein